MNTPLVAELKEKGIILSDASPMKAGQYDLSHGVPIIVVPRKPEVLCDFMIYDNVTSPDGRVLIQGTGTQYAVSVRNGEIHVDDRRTVEEDLPFGVIGVYPKDYYMANRQFIRDLESRCN